MIIVFNVFQKYLFIYLTITWLPFCFWPKTYLHTSMCVLVRYHGAKSIIEFPQFCGFLTNCLSQSAHNFKIVFLIDRTTYRHEFMMHHAIENEENSDQNFHIDVLFGLSSSRRVHWDEDTPMIRHQLWPFWTNLDRRCTSSTSLERCPCNLFFGQNLTI